MHGERVKLRLAARAVDGKANEALVEFLAAHYGVPRRCVRIEAGLIFAGTEFTDETDPFEAGIGFTVPSKKEEDYIGKAALERRRAHPQRALVGLELTGNEVAGNGDCVHVGRARIGTVTSGTRSPILKKSIALARLDIAHAAPGTEVEIGKLDGHQKRLPAVVVPFPFYDPQKKRVRS